MWPPDPDIKYDFKKKVAIFWISRYTHGMRWWPLTFWGIFWCFFMPITQKYGRESTRVQSTIILKNILVDKKIQNIWCDRFGYGPIRTTHSLASPVLNAYHMKNPFHWAPRSCATPSFVPKNIYHSWRMIFKPPSAQFLPLYMQYRGFISLLWCIFIVLANFRARKSQNCASVWCPHRGNINIIFNTSMVAPAPPCPCGATL